MLIGGMTLREQGQGEEWSGKDVAGQLVGDWLGMDFTRDGSE